MRDSLRRESELLARSWARHDPAWLREYLVTGVEDPRINLQSVLSRHFLIRALTGDRFAGLMTEECRFAAVLNWLADFASRAGDAEPLSVLLYALRRGADNAEGAEIPHYLRHCFALLPVAAAKLMVPNYIDSFLAHTSFVNGAPEFHESTLNTFQQLWGNILEPFSPEQPASPLRLPTLLEPACGSANDYRFLHAFGLARFFNYTGFDLSEKNIRNAHSLFPVTQASSLPGRRRPVGESPAIPQNQSESRNALPSSRPHFEVANVFEIPVPEKSFDLCLVHDLFEHLSPSGLEIAVKEICRVTRTALCLGFFQMDEIPNDVIRPVDDYHVNLLSVDRMKTRFAQYGFNSQVVHIATFLRYQFACDYTHNPNAYTFLLQAS